MEQFVSGITSIITGVFTALVNALGSIGQIVFTVSEAGAITGVSAFGWLLIVGIGLPLATWAFSLFFTFLKGVGKSKK